MRRSRTTRPKGSTKSWAPGACSISIAYGQLSDRHHHGDFGALGDAVAVGHDRQRIGQGGSRELVTALSSHRPDMAAPVVLECRGDTHEMDLSVGTSLDAVVTDRHVAWARQTAVA